MTGPRRDATDLVSAPDRPRIGIIGAGPAGLTAAYELVRQGHTADVFEATDATGGISQTVERDGWRFDIGGHRFYTKVPEVERIWSEVLDDDDFLTRPRLSRILYRDRLFDYPLKATNALGNLGAVEATRCVVSYVATRLRPPADQSTFEGWVAARFGWRLYRMFFKTYTEKVWGVDATEIQADWAAQRIKNLSLFTAVRAALFPGRGTQVTSLIEQFRYPRLGPGMMWERMRDLVVEQGVEVHPNSPVTRIEHRGGAVRHVVTGGPHPRRWAVDELVSSMPLGDLVRALSPAPPTQVLRAADGLRHRDFLTVALVVPSADAFPDNWIYVHDPHVQVGRIQNFGAWSPHMVKDDTTCLGLEYFLDATDDLWSAPDDALVELATREVTTLGLVPANAVQRGHVVRMPKAYPVYDQDYQEHVGVIRHWLERHVPNVHPVGRNGMHRYNNADHSMVTGLLAARNILGADHDLWAVNVDDEYLETAERPHDRGTGRAAPVLPAPAGLATSDRAA